MAQEMLTVQEAMNLFKVKRLTVYRWIKDGKLEAVKTPGGKEWRIPKEAAEAFLEVRK